MRLLLLDNFDSFTYNLLDYFQQLGCEVQVVRNDVPLAQRQHAANQAAGRFLKRITKLQSKFCKPEAPELRYSVTQLLPKCALIYI